MRFGKKKNNDVPPDIASLASLPQPGQRRSSLCEVCPTIPKSDRRISAMDLNRDGLITPPIAKNGTAHYATLSYSRRSITAPFGLSFFLKLI